MDLECTKKGQVTLVNNAEIKKMGAFCVFPIRAFTTNAKDGQIIQVDGSVSAAGENEVAAIVHFSNGGQRDHLSTLLVYETLLLEPVHLHHRKNRVLGVIPRKRLNSILMLTRCDNHIDTLARGANT